MAQTVRAGGNKINKVKIKLDNKKSGHNSFLIQTTATSAHTTDCLTTGRMFTSSMWSFNRK